MIRKKKEDELVFPYLFNIISKEIHDLRNEHVNCKLESIKKNNRKFVRSLDDIHGYDYCGYCFGKEM